MSTTPERAAPVVRQGGGRHVRDLSASAIIAGVIATLIAYAGPMAIVLQAAQSLPADVTASWVWSISVGSGVLGVWLSLRYRAPVVIAWSVPGSALLIGLLPGLPLPEVVGAYLLASGVMVVLGLSGWFDPVLARLPPAISAAMLAGILLGFALDAVAALPQQPLLVGAMALAWLIGRRWFPAYAVLAVVVVGSAVAGLGGLVQGGAVPLAPSLPNWVTPSFSLAAAVNIALPLVVVALSGQWLPGFAVMRACGFGAVPARPLIGWAAGLSMLLAPFGCHGLNVAAITAAICSGPEAHPDPARRYIAGVAGGLTYLVLGSFAATVVALFALLPAALIAALAGLALLPAIATALEGAMRAPQDRDAALVTFVVCASGLSFWGVGAAFWGLALGLGVHVVLGLGRCQTSTRRNSP